MDRMLDEYTRRVQSGQELPPAEVTEVVRLLVNPAVDAEPKAAFLTALAGRGETVPEIAAFARELRELSLELPLDARTRSGRVVDVCGTGGDRLRTFNISTTVALVVAAAGLPVAKHGNRAITSRSGSADVLEALGVRIDLSPQEAADWLRDHRFAFLFAPNYHPAFRHIAPARRLCAERGQRTVFNFLGPLLNPARPTVQLLGLPKPEWCEPIARVLQSLGVRRALVASGAVPSGPAGAAATAWLDELSPLGESRVAEYCHERGLSVGTLDPRMYPIQAARLEDLAGGDAVANADCARRVLQGNDRGPKRDAVLLNAGAALMVAEAAASVAEGWEVAARLIDSGAAAAKLEELQAASRG